MATTTEIIERYNAGQTNLKNETLFLFKTQGEAAVLDFARVLDEEIGAKPYNEVLAELDRLKAAASKPQFNEVEAAKSELYKQNIQRKRLIDQALEKDQMQSVTKSRAEDMPNLVNKNSQPILTGKRLGGPGEQGPGANMKEGGSFVSLEPERSEKNNLLLYLLLAAAAIGLLYSLSKK